MKMSLGSYAGNHVICNCLWKKISSLNQNVKLFHKVCVNICCSYPIGCTITLKINALFLKTAHSPQNHNPCKILLKCLSPLFHRMGWRLCTVEPGVAMSRWWRCYSIDLPPFFQRPRYCPLAWLPFSG